MEKEESWIQVDRGLSPGNGRRVEGEKESEVICKGETIRSHNYACPRTSEIEKMLEINI